MYTVVYVLLHLLYLLTYSIHIIHTSAFQSSCSCSQSLLISPLALKSRRGTVQLIAISPQFRLLDMHITTIILLSTREQIPLASVRSSREVSRFASVVASASTLLPSSHCCSCHFNPIADYVQTASQLRHDPCPSSHVIRFVDIRMMRGDQAVRRTMQKRNDASVLSLHSLMTK
jgi:hypothetical protein